MEQAIRDLQDAVTVMAHLEKRQSELLLNHSEHLAELHEYRRRTEQNLAEITDKLNGMIGYVDGLNHPPKP